MKAATNIPASVRQRLLNRARAEQRPFNELLQYYAMERFLHRLVRSRHGGCFILKGALLLRAWNVSEFRPTMDIDFLGRTNNAEASIVGQFRDIMAVADGSDGLVFHPDSIQTERISEDADYEGIRILFRGELDKARIHMQVDIGFSDSVYPAPIECDLPAMLDHPPPRLLCYNRESVIAEKFETMVKLGMLNSRMKDFHDIWLLSRQFNFEGPLLSEAVRRTFNRRETAITPEIEAFTSDFVSQKQPQWAAFRRRLPNSFTPLSLEDAVSAIRSLLLPVAESLSLGEVRTGRWIAPGPWRG